MKSKFFRYAIFSVASLALAFTGNFAAAANVETIVCVRHGEKPPQGLGQLTPQGLQRALALPDVLLRKFGTPQYIFAPDPAQTVNEDNGVYSYVRPLATIEPTAIRCGLPVNTQFGAKDIAALEDKLRQPEYANAVVFVAWEHLWLDKFVKQVVGDFGGDAKSVPHWYGKDYDSIYIIRITDGKTVTFTLDHEGLDPVGIPASIPAAVAPAPTSAPPTAPVD